MVKKKINFNLINTLNERVVKDWNEEIDRKIMVSTRSYNGGLTKTGRKLSEEHIARVSAANKGRIVTEETRKNISKSLKGRAPTRLGVIVSEETRRKLSKAKLGKKVTKKRIITQEFRDKMSAAMAGNKNGLGKKHSEETKRKLSKARLEFNKDKPKRITSEETKKKISIASKGKKPSKEVRERRAAAIREKINNDPEYKARLAALAKKASESARIKKLSSKGETK